MCVACLQQSPIVRFAAPLGAGNRRDWAEDGPTRWGERVMQDPFSKAERYRKQANKYGELAKNAQPAYLGDVYRKVAVRYVFMAEELLRRAAQQDNRISKQNDPTKTLKARDISLEESLTVILEDAALLKRN
jgi:hypothetical protein